MRAGEGGGNFRLKVPSRKRCVTAGGRRSKQGGEKLRKPSVIVALTVLLTLGLVSPASAASKTYTGPDGCTVTGTNNSSRAWTNAGGGQCEVFEVRAYYASGSWVGWSAWYTRSTWAYATTPNFSNVQNSQHRYKIAGGAITVMAVP